MPVLTVNVVDYNTNRAVSGAIVTISGVAVVTDNRGQAVFQVAPASYSVNVSRFNYTSETRSVTLTANQTATIRIVPRLGLL